jgi:uncharacterized protein (DUF2141 family)
VTVPIDPYPSDHRYTGATVAGSTTFAGLAPGRYVVRLMKDDGYAELAKASFTVPSLDRLSRASATTRAEIGSSTSVSDRR